MLSLATKVRLLWGITTWKGGFGDTPHVPGATIRRIKAAERPVVRSVCKISALLPPHSRSDSSLHLSPGLTAVWHGGWPVSMDLWAPVFSVFGLFFNPEFNLGFKIQDSAFFFSRFFLNLLPSFLQEQPCSFTSVLTDQIHEVYSGILSEEKWGCEVRSKRFPTIHPANTRLTWEKKSVRHTMGVCRVSPPHSKRPPTSTDTSPQLLLETHFYFAHVFFAGGVGRDRCATVRHFSPQPVAQLLFPRTPGDITRGFSAAMGAHRRLCSLGFPDLLHVIWEAGMRIVGWSHSLFYLTLLLWTRRMSGLADFSSKLGCTYIKLTLAASNCLDVADIQTHVCF